MNCKNQKSFIPIDEGMNINDDENNLSSENEGEKSLMSNNSLFEEVSELNDEKSNTIKMDINNKKIEYKFASSVILKKKRGRQTKKNSKREHNFDSQDNILRMIKVHYLNFIVSFLNDILFNLNYKERFKKLDYDFKKNINQKFLDELKRKNIGDIISNKISDKYKENKKKEKNEEFYKNFNKDIYNHLKENEVINNILSQNYLDLFKKIYYKSNRIIDLKKFGLFKTITLSINVKMFKDLQLKVKENLKNKSNKANLEQCIKRNFIPELIFMLN